MADDLYRTYIGSNRISLLMGGKKFNYVALTSVHGRRSKRTYTAVVVVRMSHLTQYYAAQDCITGGRAVTLVIPRDIRISMPGKRRGLVQGRIPPGSVTLDEALVPNLRMPFTFLRLAVQFTL